MRTFVLGNYMNAHFIHVDRLPVKGESLAARNVFREHGGKGFNLGVGLHRLGSPVTMLMAVGRDSAGVAVMQALADEGMDTRHVLKLGEASGYGVGFIAPDGSNFLAAHLGANALLTPTHVDGLCAEMHAGDWLLAQFELSLDTVRHALRRARAVGVTTYLNPSPWQALDAEWLALVDVLVVNETEAIGLLGVEAGAVMRIDWRVHLPELAALAGWRGQVLVVTLGAAGSVALDAAGYVWEAEAPAIRQLDATGAGDAFGCGLVRALSCGRSLPEALHYGNACGAHIAAREGVFAHLPRSEEIEFNPA